MTFDGEVVAVTGAGSGLGRAYALLLGREGAKVVVNDLRGAEVVVEEIRAAGGEAVADTADVAVAGNDVVATAVSTYGRLDAVINNAGVGGGGAFPDVEFDHLLDVHLGGTIALCRAAWPVMAGHGGGRIVNTSSASIFGMPGTSSYVTAKAAIFGLTRALGSEGRRAGIRVNAVMPTALTPMTAVSPDLAPLLDVYPPEGAAPFVVALASAAVPVTGETFTVGGGAAARVVLGRVPGITGITSVADCLARFGDAMDGDVEVFRTASAALRYDRDRVASTG
jgi:NAD(P)-dependent dehydrogenase (short-subunit alcohol dehydrogenase family)